jgi:hypothetical protein
MIKDRMILKTLKIAITDDLNTIDTLTKVITKPRRLMELATLKQQLQSQLLTLKEI